MVSYYYNLTLTREDLCAVLTVDGECADIFCLSDAIFLKNADAIQEWMSYVMKEEHRREGVWVWKIKKPGNELTGEKLFDELDDV